MSNFDDDYSSKMDRRHFGKILVAGAGSLALGLYGNNASAEVDAHATERLYPSGKPFRGEHKVDVVVVGAGLSGLVAARKLKQEGKSVLVLEVRRRIGGRMFLKNTIEDGVLDVGGQWVGPTQTEILKLLDELKIERFDSYETGDGKLSWNGEMSNFNGDVSDMLYGKFGLNEEDREAEKQIWNKLIAISQTVPMDKPWMAPDARKWDRETFQTWIENETKRPWARWLPAMQARIGGSGGFEPAQASVLHMAWTQRVGPQSETPEKWLLHGGAGQVPAILAKGLAERIVLAARVTSIERQDKEVIVNTARLSIKAKAVVIAIPPALRAAIEFSPPLPAVHSGLIQRMPMGSMSKVHAVYPSAFWRKQGLSGTGTGDLKTCEFIADSSPPSGMPGILTSFIAGERNVELSDASPEEIRKAVLADFSYYFGKEALEPKEFFHFNWNNQNMTGGAFTAYMPPGVWTTYGPGWREPVGNIFWAGTETSDRWPGYFDGAVRAGQNAAGAVLAGV